MAVPEERLRVTPIERAVPVSPAVSVGLAASGRFPIHEAPAYVAAQILGAVTGTAIMYLIAMGKAGFVLGAGWPANGFGDHSPGGYTLAAALLTELVLTFFFVLIVIGVTARPAVAGFAPIAVGLALTLVHLIGIPVTNTSVNPARSTGPALFVRGWALQQLWVFWLAPLVGGLLAAGTFRMLTIERGGARSPSTPPKPHSVCASSQLSLEVDGAALAHRRG